MDLLDRFHQSACELDLNRTVYDGDRGIVDELMSDEHFGSAVEALLAESPVYHSRKELLKNGLRLTERMAPQIHRIGKEARRMLGLKPDIEFYVYQDADFNAACYPPDENRLYLMLTSALVEKFNEKELCFVIGHEIGHFLFGHHRFPIHFLLENGKDQLSPIHAVKLYAWSRNAEISADRVGLLLCRDFEAAARSFFKLSSGITDATLAFQPGEYIDQFRELESEIKATEDLDPSDWYSTHPFSPMRIKALDIFFRSETYRRLIGENGGEISEENMEGEIQKFMALMEPTYLHDGGDASKLMRKFLFLGGYAIALADGTVQDSELAALKTLLGEKMSVKDEKLKEMNLDSCITRINELIGSINLHFPLTAKLNAIKNLAVIAYSDGEVGDAEMGLLYSFCDVLGIRREFVDHVLSNLGSELD